MKKNKENRITLKNRKSYFCIPFKNSNRNINLYKFIEFNNSPGWLVSQNKIEEWFFSGIITKKETSYIYGADFKGICINEILSYFYFQIKFDILSTLYTIKWFMQCFLDRVSVFNLCISVVCGFYIITSPWVVMLFS